MIYVVVVSGIRKLCLDTSSSYSSGNYEMFCSRNIYIIYFCTRTFCWFQFQTFYASVCVWHHHRDVSEWLVVGKV